MKKMNNKLVFLLILLICNTNYLFSSSYNEELLEVFSKIAPRLVVMSNQTDEIRSDINICVVNDPLDDKYGNNPEPYMSAENGRCCSSCNLKFVLPARLDYEEEI